MEKLFVLVPAIVCPSLIPRELRVRNRARHRYELVMLGYLPDRHHRPRRIQQVVHGAQTHAAEPRVPPDPLPCSYD